MNYGLILNHCLNDWITDSPDSFKNAESFSKETQPCDCSAAALLRSILDLSIYKCKPVNINYLFIELLLYKINVTFAIVMVLGRVMLRTYIISYIKYW